MVTFCVPVVPYIKIAEIKIEQAAYQSEGKTFRNCASKIYNQNITVMRGMSTTSFSKYAKIQG